MFLDSFSINNSLVIIVTLGYNIIMSQQEDSIWITTEYPEPYKNILVYDIHEGFAIAYYDNVMNMFYDTSGVSLPYVTAWQSLPQLPPAVKPLRGNIGSNYIPRVEALPRHKKD